MAIQTAVATFTGAEDSVAVTWSSPFSSSPTLITAGVVISDSGGAVAIDIPSASVTGAGCTVETSARFAGAVELIASGT
jgi:hypothetical protein